MIYKNVVLMLHEAAYSLNIPLEGEVKTTSDYEYEDYDENALHVVWETSIQPLTDLQRIIFFVLTIIVTVVSVAGNVLVLYVNVSRKQRFLFRACLISLAVSDLIFVVVTACIYLSRFNTPSVALWKLGPVACSLIPFLQTMVVLVNSILLVCIALDRYMAVIRICKGSWEPSKLCTLSSCVLIWGFSAAVSSPLLTIYDHSKVYVVPLPDPEEEDPELTYYVANLCGSNKAENGYYFAIISSFIFIPLLITFLWLNSVLAKELWKRRIDVTASVVENENVSTVSTGTTQRTQEIYVTPELMARRVERKQRLVRMFKVILMLMVVFFLCRLPNWIYLLYKLNNSTQENIHWVLNYAFGLTVMANCMLNPFLYTFLSETIRLTTFLAGIVCGIFRWCVGLCLCEPCKRKERDGAEFEKPHMFNNM